MNWQKISELAERHMRAEFPRDCYSDQFILSDGNDLVYLDGLASRWYTFLRKPPKERPSNLTVMVREDLARLEEAVGMLSGEARGYFQNLFELNQLVVAALAEESDTHPGG